MTEPGSSVSPSRIRCNRPPYAEPNTPVTASAPHCRHHVPEDRVHRRTGYCYGRHHNRAQAVLLPPAMTAARELRGNYRPRHSNAIQPRNSPWHTLPTIRGNLLTPAPDRAWNTARQYRVPRPSHHRRLATPAPSGTHQTDAAGHRHQSLPVRQPGIHHVAASAFIVSLPLRPY